MHSQR
jgi:hypothetical protein